LMSRSLSKSDFKIARECITKLYYKKMRYPSVTEADPFMQLLAEGGYMVGKLAQLLYPGILIERMENAIQETSNLIKTNENVCIHEATIESNGKLIRIDVLNKKGKTLELIEVKAKSWKSDEYDFKNKNIRREFQKYLEDVAFQYYVLTEAFPEFDVEPYLFLPDKAKRTTIDGLNSQFTIKPLPETSGGFRGFDVRYTGNIDDLLKDDIMTLVDVKKPVLGMLLEITSAAEEFLKTLNPTLIRKQEIISVHCKDCEYRISEESEQNGFLECWGEMANTKNHILDLFQLGNINRIKDIGINEMITEGKSSYKDLDTELFKDKYNNRPYYQAILDEELIIDTIFDEINFEYPLCFIDFECSRMALPYHKGMRPYENIAFQWSCHTLLKPGAAPTHSDWINTTDTFPNFAFAETLMNQIKDAGTVLIWSSYENSILKDIYEQMDIYGYRNHDLKKWLECFVKFEKDDNCGYIDLANLCNKYYHHPLCIGKFSIKYVLPAVLDQCNSPRIADWLQQINLLQKDAQGKIIDPYESLPEIIVGIKTVVKDGTGAIRAYQDMLYGLHKNDPVIKADWEKALREYCRLDTLAMLIIWEYWKSRKAVMRVVSSEQ
jgi:uncharacterized protein DUF2779